MLKYQDDRPFSKGVISCSIRPIHPENNNRIFIQIEVEGLPIEAVLDTGGIYCVLHPVMADQIGFDQSQALGTHSQRIRGNPYNGNLFKANLAIQAEEGEGLLQEVTVFVPDATDDEWGDLPSFLGLTGCLEFIRFAVDPSRDQFYFSSIDGD